MKRRNFLKVSSLASGGLMLSWNNAVFAKTFDKPQNCKFSPFLSISTNNEITFYLTKHEMGQSLDTSLPMILAEELGANWETLRVEYLDFDKTLPNFDGQPDFMATGGSYTIVSTYNILRNAGATAREMLTEAAARRWKVSKEDCFAEQGNVHKKNSKKYFTFGELASDAITMAVPDKVTLKEREKYSIVGKSIKSIKSKSIVNGQLKYSLDVDLPEMVYASIIRSPVVGGKAASFDDSKAKEIDGVIAIFKIEGRKEEAFHLQFEEGIAVVATSTWASLKGKKLLEVNWKTDDLSKRTLEYQKTQISDKFVEGIETGLLIGEVDNAILASTEKINATYEVPYLAHATMEPLNATVHFRDGKCDIWAGSQAPQFHSQYIAKLLEIPLENIVFHTYPSGGSFGRKYFVDYIAEATLISKRLEKPVKLMWSREDCFQNGRYHPLREDRYEIGLSENPINAAINYSSVTTFFRTAGNTPIYPFKNYKESVDKVASTLNTGPWRSVTAHPAALGQEGIINEMAHYYRQNALDFRLQLLENGASNLPESLKYIEERNKYLIPKLKRVLEELKEKSNWSYESPKGSGKGLAIHVWGDSVCAQVAEVTVQNGELFINKIICVAECGLIINPNHTEAQISGSILWALSALKLGGIKIKNGAVGQSNFHDYEILRMDESPKLEVHLLESDEPPNRVGELGVPPLAPAVLEAIFQATGKRIRKIPVLKEDLV